MATLNKKLKIKSGSSTQSCNLYTTTTEAGSDNLKLKVDNQNVYASLTTTSDSKASKGRIKKSGTTKAIAISGKPPYTEKSWTTAGTYTFTVPSGVTRIRVAVCGGGGGGSDPPYKKGSILTGESGGTSQFGNLIQASGGGGGKIHCYGSQTHAKTQSISYKNYYYIGTAGSPNGIAGSTSGFSLSFDKKTGNYGAGGIAYNDQSIGGTGGYNSGYIKVNPLHTYTIIVGSGGSPALNSQSGHYAKNGASGFVLIAYGGDI